MGLSRSIALPVAVPVAVKVDASGGGGAGCEQLYFDDTYCVTDGGTDGLPMTFSPGVQYTVAGWVQFDGPNNITQQVFAVGAFNGFGLRARTVGGDPGWEFSCWGANSGASLPDPVPGQPHHFMVETTGGSGTTARWWIDGIERTPVTQGINTTVANMYLGWRALTDTTSLTGLIEDFSISNQGAQFINYSFTNNYNDAGTVLLDTSSNNRDSSIAIGLGSFVPCAHISNLTDFGPTYNYDTSQSVTPEGLVYPGPEFAAPSGVRVAYSVGGSANEHVEYGGSNFIDPGVTVEGVIAIQFQAITDMSTWSGGATFSTILSGGDNDTDGEMNNRFLVGIEGTDFVTTDGAGGRRVLPNIPVPATSSETRIAIAWDGTDVYVYVNGYGAVLPQTVWPVFPALFVGGNHLTGSNTTNMQLASVWQRVGTFTAADLYKLTTQDL